MNFFRHHTKAELLEQVNGFIFDPDDDQQAQIEYALELWDACDDKGVDCERLFEEFASYGIDLGKEYKR